MKARPNQPRKTSNAAASPASPASPAYGELSLKQASKRVERAPNDPAGWKALGVHWLNQKRWDEAREPIERALKLAPQDPEALEMLARVVHNQGDDIQGIALLEQALELDFGFAQAHLSLSKIRFGRAENEQALDHIDQALMIQPRHLGMLSHRGNVLYRLHRYQDAIEVFDELLNKQPESYSHWNNAANLRRDLGLLDEADRFYRQAIERTTVDAKPYSNRLTALHYNPSISRNTILDVCREWEKRYGPAQAQLRPQPHNRAPNKRLRIGMISDGFRRHPVGRMITAALEKLATQEVALYAYSTNNAVDPLTVRMRKTTTQWLAISHLSDEALAQQIRDDEIDILIDLAGHNTGSRMRVMAMQPAPLLVKWVGGLINTTGLSAIDYLLTDSVESPEGEDPYYSEKLIRLPDDYICYDPSDVQAEQQALPALRNGYITLGCFNNPAKVNEVALAEWAKIMHQLPGSQLFLKGFQYSSEALCQRVRDIMASHDIPATRLIIEGPSPHKELMGTYNRVDIALDPWPYSGGLTTCEAFFMGVPVVTLPGPTFAGRHSATHLVNAGMPELVVSSWDEYRERVIELASDLDSLSTIRSHLRDVLLQSPVCDAPRFAKHFTTAMRAIWQRYSEGKMPAALALDKDGQAQFEDEDQTVEILHAEPLAEEQDEFRWQLEGKIIVIDNSGKLVSQGSIHRLRQLNAFGVVAFDPTSCIQNPTQFEGSEDIQVLPHVTLGNGEPGKLYACLDPAFSSTLEPMPLEQQHGANPQGAKVLTELPINTIALDSIEGLDSLDWLILDELSDATAILENGEKALKDTLAIQVRIAFQPTHQRQPNLAEVQHWMARHGFRFYRFNDMAYQSHLSESAPSGNLQATELTSADALFLPSYERMAELSEALRTKLAFLLHTVYGIKDMAYKVLAGVNEEKAEGYLVEDNSAQAPSDFMPKVEITQCSEYTEGILHSHSSADNVSDDIDELLESQAPSASLVASADEQTINKKTDHISTTPKASKNLWELDDFIYVVDVGANPIDGTPPYSSLLKKGVVKLVGFEPQKDALQKLQTMKGSNETYLPHAVGTGEKTKLYLCQASGMTSTLKPNNLVLNHFQGYPIWGKVKSVEEIDTVRLDDVDKIEKIDWLKIDIQGGELNVFQNAEEKLKDALVIQTEVNFIQLYENQPLFAEIDQWMRSHGFMLHTLLEQRKRLYAPMKINGGIHQGINQLTTADAVYVRDINKLEHLSQERIKKLAFILHEAYGSYDLSLRILKNIRSGFGDKYTSKMKGNLPIKLNINKNFGEGKYDKKIIHICFNNLHVQPLVSEIENINNNAKFKHKVYIEHSRSIPNYDVDVSKSKDAIYFDEKKCLNEILKKCLIEEVEGIIFHGLFFDWQKRLVKSIGAHKKTIWVMWGGDLYSPVASDFIDMSIYNNLNAVSTNIEGDYRFFLKNYTNKPLIPYKHAASVSLESIVLPEEKEDSIIIGNSGDPSNQHLDIIQAINNKADKESFSYILPLAYNMTPGYLDNIKNALLNAGVYKKCFFIEKMLPPQEYFSIVAKSKGMITAHNRQQAVGNISASLYFENFTVLREKYFFEGEYYTGSVWENLKKKGVEGVFSFEKFCAASKISDFLGFEKSGKNKEIIKREFDGGNYLDAIKEMENRIENL